MGGASGTGLMDDVWSTPCLRHRGKEPAETRDLSTSVVDFNLRQKTIKRCGRVNSCWIRGVQQVGVNTRSELSMTDEDAGSHVSPSLCLCLSATKKEEKVGGGGVLDGRYLTGEAKVAKKDRDRTTCQL